MVQAVACVCSAGAGAVYRRFKEKGLWKATFTRQCLLAVLSAGLCRVTRAEVITFFQHENLEDPTWATPGETLRSLEEEALRQQAGQGARRITHSGRTRGREHSSQLAGALPLCTPLARSRHARATSPPSQRHLAKNGKQSREELLAVMEWHSAARLFQIHFLSLPSPCRLGTSKWA